MAKLEHYQSTESEWADVGYIQVTNEVRYSPQHGYNVSTFDIEATDNAGNKITGTMTESAFCRLVEGMAEVHGDVELVHL